MIKNVTQSGQLKNEVGARMQGSSNTLSARPTSGARPVTCFRSSRAGSWNFMISASKILSFPWSLGP